MYFEYDNFYSCSECGATKTWNFKNPKLVCKKCCAALNAKLFRQESGSLGKVRSGPFLLDLHHCVRLDCGGVQVARCMYRLSKVEQPQQECQQTAAVAIALGHSRSEVSLFLITKPYWEQRWLIEKINAQLSSKL